jgi:hypothetical protein
MLFCTMLQLPLLNLGAGTRGVWGGGGDGAQQRVMGGARGAGRPGRRARSAAGAPPPHPRRHIHARSPTTAGRAPVHAAVALAGRPAHDELHLAGRWQRLHVRRGQLRRDALGVVAGGAVVGQAGLAHGSLAQWCVCVCVCVWVGVSTDNEHTGCEHDARGDSTPRRTAAHVHVHTRRMAHGHSPPGWRCSCCRTRPPWGCSA